VPQLDNGSPFTLNTGVTLTLTQPGQSGTYLNQTPPAWVILQNNSQLNLAWRNGSDTGSISPLGADVILLSTGGINTVTILPMGTGTGQLFVTWSQDGDPVPTNYPTGNTTITNLVIGNAGLIDPNIGGGNIPLVPILSTGFVAGTGISVLALPAPVTGAWYLFSADLLNFSGGSGYGTILLATTDVDIAMLASLNSYAPDHVDFKGYRTTEGIDWNAPADFDCLIRYAPGP
jgi:hypothetical protein